MGWLNDLYETYEACAGKDFGGRTSLIPIAHSTQNAQIEVVIDGDGKFLRAVRVEKADTMTLIPVTEDSANRTSGACAHPLCDKLEYVAGDYSEYAGKDCTKKHEMYLSGLRDWAESPFSCGKVRAIFNYLSAGTLVQDLIGEGVLIAEDGRLTGDKINTIDQAAAFVRFRVDIPGELESAVWKDAEVQKSYIDYYISKQDAEDICYATGRRMACSDKHPGKIRNTGDKAKLISSNDSHGFTYRGRFTDSGQAASIGFETSQKAHNALRWLVENQGFHIGDRTFVAWEQHGSDIPSPMQDSFDAMPGMEELSGSGRALSGQEYAQKLKKAANGFRENLATNAKIMVMVLEGATPGRLSIAYYKKFAGSDYINNIEHWYGTCCWRLNKYLDGKSIEYSGTPSPKEIAEAALGKQSDKAFKSTVARILPCIIDRRSLPYDLVASAVRRASNPASFDNDFSYKRILAITCAMVRKSRYDKYKEEWDMALDTTRTDRSYLFGRLLATAQMLEQSALGADEKGRTTAAERYKLMFSRRPRKTWRVIESALDPYIKRQKARGHTYYFAQIGEIISQMDEPDFESDERLDDTYLLGYHSQLNAYWENIKSHKTDLEGGDGE